MTDAPDASPDEKPIGQSSSHWQMQLELSEREQKDWKGDGKKVIDRYRSARKDALRRNSKRFNILYSNTEVLRSALYAKAAKPDVRRRFTDKDPTGRQVAEIVERALVYCADAYDADKPMDAAVFDYVLPGRGVVRVEYEPVLGQRPKFDPMTAQPMMGEDGQPITEDFVAEQRLRESYVFWEDFLCSPARAWDKVTWVAFRHLMTKDEIEQAFPDCVDVPMNWLPDIKGREGEVPSVLSRAEVWEIWDKGEKKRHWVVKGYPRICRSDEDPYQLEDFLPLPEPLVSYSTNDSIIPEPEFHAYQDQADDLDEVTKRISVLTKAMKRRGVYDQSVKELKRLANANDNEFIAVESMAALAAKGGLAKAFETEDVSMVAKVLIELYKQRDMLVASIYEVTGMSDIMRGSSDASETLGAQQLKAQFGSMRLKRRQRAVQRFIRGVFRIKAEIIANHFEPHVLQDMTQIQITPDVMQMLRSDKLRTYHIDIETDSTIFEDAAVEKAARTEVVGAVGQLIEKGAPVLQMMPQMAPMFFAMLSFAVRSFKEGRELEDVIDEAQQAFVEAAQQKAQQPPPPNPEQIKAEAMQAKAQADQQKMQADLQGKQMDMAHSQQIHQADLVQKQMDIGADQQKHAMDLQKMALAHQQAKDKPKVMQ